MSEYEIELYKIIGNMLRNERTKLDMTLEQVANELGLTSKTIQRYEQGERKIKIDTIIRLCELYGIDYDDFMSQAKLYSVNIDHVVPERLNKYNTVVKNNGEIANQYYIDPKTVEIAQTLKNNPSLKMLFDAGKDVPEDVLECAFYISVFNCLRVLYYNVYYAFFEHFFNFDS